MVEGFDPIALAEDPGNGWSNGRHSTLGFLHMVSKPVNNQTWLATLLTKCTGGMVLRTNILTCERVGVGVGAPRAYAPLPSRAPRRPPVVIEERFL